MSFLFPKVVTHHSLPTHSLTHQTSTHSLTHRTSTQMHRLLQINLTFQRIHGLYSIMEGCEMKEVLHFAIANPFDTYKVYVVNFLFLNLFDANFCILVQSEQKKTSYC